MGTCPTCRVFSRKLMTASHIDVSASTTSTSKSPSRPTARNKCRARSRQGASWPGVFDRLPYERPWRFGRPLFDQRRAYPELFDGQHRCPTSDSEESWQDKGACGTGRLADSYGRARVRARRLGYPNRREVGRVHRSPQSRFDEIGRPPLVTYIHLYATSRRVHACVAIYPSGQDRLAVAANAILPCCHGFQRGWGRGRAERRRRRRHATILTGWP